jgi:hypothetical protein
LGDTQILCEADGWNDLYTKLAVMGIPETAVMSVLVVAESEDG